MRVPAAMARIQAGAVMKRVLRWAVLAVALATGVTMVAGSPAGAAGVARAGALAPATAPATVATGLINHRITGTERAVSCLTPARCVAVGSGIRDGRPGGQVVEVVGGKQARISPARFSQVLYAVSCPSKAGCWAMGTRKASPSQLMVRIGPSGKVTKVISVKLPAGVPLNSISCNKMTSCEVWGAIPNYSPYAFYFGKWTGKELRLHNLGEFGGDSADTGGISCWHATCTATGGWANDGYNSGSFVVITNHGRLVKVITTADGFDDISCVSFSTCYAVGFRTVGTLHDGVPGNIQNEPVYAPEGGPAIAPAIACAGTTCWATGPAPDHKAGPEDESVFVTITKGAPASSVVVDPALLWPAITSRGDGFAAVGAAVNAGYRVTEYVTG
jgi:hypothetical protein